MSLSNKARILLASIMGIGLTFIYFPLSVVVVNSFNSSKTFSWPPNKLTFQWWQKAIDNTGVREALGWSIIAGLSATAIALISLG